MAVDVSEDGIKFINSTSDFKEVVTTKFLNRNNQTAQQIAEETGVTTKTLYNWADKYSNGQLMKKKSRSTFEKMKLVIEFNALSEEQKGAFLRSHGLYEEQVKEWQTEVLTGEIEKFTENLARKNLEETQKELKKVKKDLKKKEEALAEAAALLILKKKAEGFWGEDEE